MLNHHLKIAWRNLLRSRGFSFLNIAGLAVGMAVALIIGLWVFDEISYDRFHEKYDRLYQVYLTDYYGEEGENATFQSVPLPLAEAFRNEFPEIKYAAECDWGWQHSLVKGDKRFFEYGLQTDADFLKMYSFPLLHGDGETALTDPFSIVLTESMAGRIFENEDPMGKTIRVDDRADVTVTGVVADPPSNSTHQFNFIMPFGQWETWATWVTESRSNWGNNSFKLFIELAEGVDEVAFGQKIKNIVKEHDEESKAEVVLHPIEKWRLYTEWEDGKAEGGFIEYVRMFGIIGFFVLLIACINFMNLSTARSERRAKEVGIRKTVGSGRRQLIGQFLGEAVLLALVAFGICIVFIELALPWFNDLTGKELNMPYGNPIFILATIGFVLLTGILAGSYPAFFLSSFKPIGVLNGLSPFRGAGGGGNRARQVLVVSQFTVSVALIIATLVIWQQIDHVQNRPMGYDANRLLSVFSSQDLIENYDIVKTEMLASGAVESITRASSPITAIYANMTGVTWPGQSPNDEVLFATVATSWDYTKTLGIKMLEGRDFSEQMGTDTSSVIFNQAAIERMGLENPLGQTVTWDESPLTIIGVMDNVIMNSPFTPIQPTMLVCVPDWIDQMMFRLSPNVSTEEALARLEPIFEKHNPSYPFEYQFVDEAYGKKFGRIQMVGKIAMMFGGLAIFISCLGLFGLAAYMAERRTKEIGIRKVLGASVLNLWGMLSKDFLGLVVISCVLAMPLAAYFLGDWLEQYEYRIDLNWWVFGVALVLAVAVTLLTVSFQGVKAALANPVESLRSE